VSSTYPPAITAPDLGFGFFMDAPPDRDPASAERKCQHVALSPIAGPDEPAPFEVVAPIVDLFFDGRVSGMRLAWRTSAEAHRNTYSDSNTSTRGPDEDAEQL
jgi:hypothetical protein